jgi:hypothetical protein
MHGWVAYWMRPRRPQSERVGRTRESAVRWTLVYLPTFWWGGGGIKCSLVEHSDAYNLSCIMHATS